MADTIYGRNLREARRVGRVSLSAFPVNGAATHYVYAIPTGGGKFRVEAVYWVASAVLNDADGTMLVDVTARDVSEGADDAIVSSASVEGGTAHAVAAFTLAAEGSEKEFTLDEGDSIRVTFTNNSAAIDTNGAISVFVVGFPLPEPYEAGPGVRHESAY
jgi:hypothetical protein